MSRSLEETTPPGESTGARESKGAVASKGAVESSGPLAVAYAAYHRTAPSDREVNFAVMRLRARMRSRQRRLRVGSLMTFAIVFIGAVAYAAGVLDDRSVGVQTLGDARPAEPKPGARAGRVGGVSARSSAAPHRVELTQGGPERLASSEPAAARPTADVRSVLPTRAPVARTPHASPNSAVRSTHGAERRGAAWAEVAEAMAAKDYARAEGALRELTKSDTADTRNNATLGLAQLALGRGDCTEARRLATRVLQSTPNAQARRRGEDVLARCAPR